MFLSFSKTIAKIGGFRIGIGTRINKKNAGYALIGVVFYYMLLMCWYMMVGCLWLVYAMCYGFYWVIKKIILLIKEKKEQE